MNDFYSEPRDGIFRPGGLALTKEAIKKCSFEKGAKICDIGCGDGETVSFLRQMGFDACGIDPNAAQNADHIIRLSAEDTTLPDDSFDGVFFECSLSLSNVPYALKEAARIVKKGGKMVISDIYSERGGKKEDGAVRKAFAKEEILAEVKNAGFEICQFEDRSHDIVTFYLQMIMDGRESEICGDCEYLKSIKAGYFLLIAEKV